jgi:hypothetical protein
MKKSKGDTPGDGGHSMSANLSSASQLLANNLNTAIQNSQQAAAAAASSGGTPNGNQFVCFVCYKTFTSQASLTLHLTYVHLRMAPQHGLTNGMAEHSVRCIINTRNSYAVTDGRETVEHIGQCRSNDRRALGHGHAERGVVVVDIPFIVG